jgi:hypothetical protein
MSHCAEHVCCNSACGATCNSCLNVNTGTSDGTCAVVKAGTSHGSDCVASDPTTCQLDGKCDGAGACRKYVSGTGCGTESCTDGASVSTYSSARTCNGQGTCSAATTSMCGSEYRCSGTKCKTTCSAASDCVPSAYCSSSACVAKKADGQVCGAAAECANGVCGGRCCAAGCTCTQPSSANVLPDPGIDVDVSHWTTNVGTISRVLMDAEKCPYSGSLAATGTTSEQVVGVCAHNVPLVGDFNFGARYTYTGTQAPQTVICQANFYSGFNCDGDLITQQEAYTPTAVGQWQSISSSVSGVSGSNSVQLVCYLFPQNTGDTYYLDMVYVSKMPATY